MSDWTDTIVGDRMTVDREFNDRVTHSQFSSQEWGLIMTAIDFDIEHADDPERARIVADTENLPEIMPELENVRSQMSAMGGAGGDDRGGGVFDSIKGALGIGGGGGGVDEERLQSARRLTQEYADELQAHLESEEKWERVRTTYLE